MDDPRHRDHELHDDRQVLPVVEERLEVSRRRHETGRVRVTKRVEERREVVDEPTVHERVEVTRVPIGRVVSAAPSVREEGDVTIVPVLEEVVVVEKRLVLKEELHIRRVREEVRAPQEVTLRTERVEVERGGERLSEPEA